MHCTGENKCLCILIEFIAAIKTLKLTIYPSGVNLLSNTTLDI